MVSMSKWKYKLDIISIEYYSCEHTFISDEPLTAVQLQEKAEEAIHDEKLYLDTCATHIDALEVNELP